MIFCCCKSCYFVSTDRGATVYQNFLKAIEHYTAYFMNPLRTIVFAILEGELVSSLPSRLRASLCAPNSHRRPTRPKCPAFRARHHPPRPASLFVHCEAISVYHTAAWSPTPALGPYRHWRRSSCSCVPRPFVPAGSATIPMDSVPGPIQSIISLSFLNFWVFFCISDKLGSCIVLRWRVKVKNTGTCTRQELSIKFHGTPQKGGGEYSGRSNVRMKNTSYTYEIFYFPQNPNFIWTNFSPANPPLHCTRTDSPRPHNGSPHPRAPIRTRVRKGLLPLRAPQRSCSGRSVTAFGIHGVHLHHHPHRCVVHTGIRLLMCTASNPPYRPASFTMRILPNGFPSDRVLHFQSNRSADQSIP